MSSSAQESITCTSSHRAISHETTHTRRIQQSEEWKDSSVLPLDKRISVCSQSDAHNLRLLFLTPTKAATTNSAFNHFGHSITNDSFTSRLRQRLERLRNMIFAMKDSVIQPQKSWDCRRVLEQRSFTQVKRTGNKIVVDVLFR